MKKIKLLLLMITLVALAGCSENMAGKDFSLGEWNGKTYVNAFAELEYNIPEDWTICSKEEMRASLTNVNSTQYCDAMAKSNDGRSITIFMYEDLTNDRFMDEEEYLTGIQKQFGRERKNDTGDILATEVRMSSKISKKMFGEKQYYVLPTEFDSMNIKQDFAVRKVGDYMVVILTTSIL